jgi:hypothetical protein
MKRIQDSELDNDDDGIVIDLGNNTKEKDTQEHSDDQNQDLDNLDNDLKKNEILKIPNEVIPLLN